MVPSEDDELTDLLREWPAPSAPSSLERRLFAARRSWWRTSISLPVPFAFILAMLMAALLWRSAERLKPIPERIVVKTERVLVPVVQERVVTKVVYKNRAASPPSHALTFADLRPVGELRLKIMRHSNAQN